MSGVVRSRYLFLQVLMIMKKCLQTYYDIAIALENFLRNLKSSVVIHKIVTFTSFSTILALKVVWKGMKLKKSPSPYVFVNKNCFRCRAIMLFGSASTHDHKKVFTNLLHYCHCSKKFLRHTKSSEVSHKIVNFCLILNTFCSQSGLKGYETEKITVCLRFRK